MKKFWTQLVVTGFFALIAPVTYLILRYNLFQTTSKLQIGLWGVVVIFIVFFVLKALISFYLEGMKTKYSYLKQIVSGFSKVLFPLFVLLVILVLIKDNTVLLIESTSVIIGCEAIAIMINPLPKWAFDNNVEGLGEIIDKISKKGE